jgi:hypothetical protein
MGFLSSYKELNGIYLEEDVRSSRAHARICAIGTKGVKYNKINEKHQT